MVFNIQQRFREDQTSWTNTWKLDLENSYIFTLDKGTDNINEQQEGCVRVLGTGTGQVRDENVKQWSILNSNTAEWVDWAEKK